MNKETELDLLRSLQSLAINCSQFAEGKLDAKTMAFYCKNIATNIAEIIKSE